MRGNSEMTRSNVGGRAWRLTLVPLDMLISFSCLADKKAGCMRTARRVRSLPSRKTLISRARSFMPPWVPSLQPHQRYERRWRRYHRQ